MKGKTVGYRGGILNGAQIRQDLDEIFHTGTVPSPDQQIQQAGVDLLLERVLLLGPFDVEVPFGADGWVFLKKGAYYVELQGGVKKYAVNLQLWPRSTLFRIGVTLAPGLGKMVDAQDKKIGAMIQVLNPHGLWLQKGARISQAIVRDPFRIFPYPNGPVATSERLTVEHIYTFKEAGRLGVEERHVEVATERDLCLLQKGEGCLLKFGEIVSVAPDEVILSLSDKMQTGMYVMGAIDDPGHNGKLGGCFFSGWGHPVRLEVGFKAITLLKHRITPVAEDGLYNGRYQGDIDLPETLKWYPLGERSGE